MTIGRAVALLLVLGALALCVVQLRSERVRCAARVADLRSERLRMRRESWALQMEIARLRTPDQIRECIERYDLQVLLPHPPLSRARSAALAESR
ncbi:MAG TPA: hypothetical protein VGM03_01595 [Phycisphaerae bacterium]|jgi:hypothetical protein